MATLPPGWVSDYDGQRWFWVYTATNHTQYTFPKEGDEWPDYAHFSGVSFGNALLPDAELLPEERLESERQIRRRAAADGSSGSDTRTRNRARRSVGDTEMDDGIGGIPPVDAFEQFGYLGPGAWEDVVAGTCPLQQPSELSSHTAVHAVVGAASPPPLSVSELSADAATHTSDISLVQSLGTISHSGIPLRRPRNPNESAQTTTFDGNTNNTQAHAHQSQTSTPSQENEDAVPFLDSREIIITASPILVTTPPNLPELASASTALCAEELNPPPVELPDTQRTWLEPVPVPNLVNQYPVDMSCTVDGGGNSGGVAQTRSQDGHETPAVLRVGSGERHEQQRRHQHQQASIGEELMGRKMVHTDQVPKPLALKQPSQNPPPTLVAQSAEDNKNKEEVNLHAGDIAQTYTTASRKEEARGEGGGGAELPKAYERLSIQTGPAQHQQQNLQTILPFRPKAPFWNQPRMLLVNGRSDLPSQMAPLGLSTAQSTLQGPMITLTAATPVTATAPPTTTATLQQQAVLYPLEDARTHQSEVYQHQLTMPLPLSTPALPNQTTHTNTDNNMRTDQGMGIDMGTATNQGTQREEWNRIVASAQKRWGKVPSVLRPGPRSRC